MAGLITVRLSRSDAQPWGFRLQGGKDFGAPLLIQKVNGGSLAEKAGLQVADAVIKVNGQDVYNLRHKDAQDAIVKAGNSFEVVVSRGPGGTWKPSVTPVGNIPAPSPVGGAPAPVTKTSLAYKGPASPAIGTGHNVAARPFSAAPQLNGVGDQGSVKSITSKQYNNPVGLYSEQTIAETLSAQAEVLAGGVLGVNFMKNEKTYNATNSEVLKMVQEIDKEPKEPEPVESVVQPGGMSAPPPTALGLRHVAPPENKPPSTTSPQQPLQPGQNVCADCERLIVGVFVRIKDKNLHVECFKCATCGTSLKNVGYYNINNKLYCDIHAKLVARSNPPAPNLDPITIPPGGRIPSGAISAPQPSGGLQSPQPGTLAPLPFHPQTPTSTFSGPKPFGAPASAPAPFSTPAAPVSAHVQAPFSSVSAPAPPPAAPVPAPFSAAPAAPALSSFPKSLPGQAPQKPLGKKGN
uniref:PDZ domain-containing protein n=1 Tax=Cuerna arida TaxID=1464854 RepID=A0A1B6H173_9HEMI